MLIAKLVNVFITPSFVERYIFKENAKRYPRTNALLLIRVVQARTEREP